MSRCNSPSFEKMLHAYELGMLSEDDRKRLEIHMLECDYCFGKVQKLAEAAEIIKSDDDSRIVIAGIVKKNESTPSFWSRFLKWLWPESPRFFILKPAAIVGLLIILSAYPVYRIAWQPRESNLYGQILNLYPLRGSLEQNYLSLARGGEATINFVCEDAEAGKSYKVTVESSGGVIVFSDENFVGFNNGGLGSITLPLTIFEKGNYKLSISDIQAGRSEIIQIYHFAVK